jgi:type II site-specific deoxyribonuclease
MVTFREFKVGDLFDGASGDTDIKKEHLNDEGYPVITAGVDNLGVAGYSSINAKILPENSLTVDMFGNCYFRPFEFKMVTHSRVFALTLKNRPLTQEAGLFICTILKWLQSKYNYSNMCTYNKIKNELIQLPVKPGTDEINYTEEDIDWDYMESYIHDLEQSYIHDLDAYLQETGLNDYTLTDDEQALLESELVFKEFKVGDLFTLTGLKQVKSQKNIVESETGIPFVVQSTKNNMVKCHVDRQALLDGGENVYDGNAIVLGVTLPAVSYQELEFGASQVITARRDDLNTLRGLYIVTAMRKALLPKYSYTNKPGIQKYKDDIIQLPVKPGTDEVNYTEDDIDWDYMESYIRVMEKQVIADVVDYKESVIITAKELVYV